MVVNVSGPRRLVKVVPERGAVLDRVSHQLVGSVLGVIDGREGLYGCRLLQVAGLERLVLCLPFLTDVEVIFLFI